MKLLIKNEVNWQEKGKQNRLGDLSDRGKEGRTDILMMGDIDSGARFLHGAPSKIVHTIPNINNGRLPPATCFHLSNLLGTRFLRICLQTP